MKLSSSLVGGPVALDRSRLHVEPVRLEARVVEVTSNYGPCLCVPRREVYHENTELAVSPCEH
jgi:hypothetical protein